jgi:hypothetical protein
LNFINICVEEDKWAFLKLVVGGTNITDVSHNLYFTKFYLIPFKAKDFIVIGVFF